MMPVRELRNAVAHNNCVLNDLSPGTSARATNYAVSRELGLAGIKKTSFERKMSNVRIQQIVTLFFTHKQLVTSVGVRENRSRELHEFTTRMLRDFDYYQGNDQISSSLIFFKKVIDGWFPIRYSQDN